MPRPSSVLCPSCGSLVGVKDPQCLTCGRRHPGMWGFAHLLRNVGEDMGFTDIVMWGCGALYLASLAADLQGVAGSAGLSFFSPSSRSLFLFGASGAMPVFAYGRWWTVLSAAWLHGGVLHILLNMMGVRNLLRPVAHLYGPARTILIYTVASVIGFSASSAAGAFLPRLLGGSFLTVGASAPLMGLVGALSYYGRRGGSTHIGQQAKGIVVAMIVFGFVMPGIDNWAHLGGFAGGWVAARVLDPLKPERGDHVLMAVACLALSLISVVLSVVLGLPLFRP
ncbi:MAG TPA: rhomboid family intramembrane serine protease [Vicinamibacteria bacterium]|nr:rhomboid family intramembrane serine protease [Vicinamibacteria bacterium]